MYLFICFLDIYIYNMNERDREREREREREIYIYIYTHRVSRSACGHSLCCVQPGSKHGESGQGLRNFRSPDGFGVQESQWPVILGVLGLPGASGPPTKDTGTLLPGPSAQRKKYLAISVGFHYSTLE